MTTESKIHELKTWPAYWPDLESGKKRFEIRYNDRNFRVGDILHLREWLPDRCIYTGRELWFKVTCILSDFSLGLKPGYVVLSIEFLKVNKTQ